MREKQEFTTHKRKEKLCLKITSSSVYNGFETMVEIKMNA